MLHNYAKNADGLVYQIEKQPMLYNQDYIKNSYDTYGELNNYMSHMRLGYVLGVVKEPVNSVLDIGYGNGAFLKTCQPIIPDCFGYDVTDYQIPEGIKFTPNWIDCKVDVTTFFDVIEHLEDPYIIKNSKSKYIIISLPLCHYDSDEWFDTWKHRKPNEHLWHFNKESMYKFAASCGFEVIHHTNIEDKIRGTLNGKQNILTVCLKNKNL